MKEFNTQEEAFVWMSAEVDDPCTDNYRFAYLDDSKALQGYTDKENDGCCGYFDQVILVSGKMAKIGCNYGH